MPTVVRKMAAYQLKALLARSPLVLTEHISRYIIIIIIIIIIILLLLLLNLIFPQATDVAARGLDVPDLDLVIQG